VEVGDGVALLLLDISFPFLSFGEELMPMNVILQALQIEVPLGFERSRNFPAYGCNTVLHAHM
jgi:hypothetical protein